MTTRDLSNVPNATVTDVLKRSRARVEKSRHNFLYCICCFLLASSRIRMEPRMSLLGRHKKLFYVDNVTMKCPHCKLLLTFGVPISQTEYWEELLLREKLGLSNSVRAEMEDDQTLERLKVLGYV